MLSCMCVDSVEVWHDDKLSTPCCAGTSDKRELEFEFVPSVDVNSSDCIVWLISPLKRMGQGQIYHELVTR